MPSDKPDKVDKWRHPVSAVRTVSETAFIERALEDGLRVVRCGGYLYMAVETDDGYDITRTFEGWDSVPVSIAATADPAANNNPAEVTVTAGKRWLLLSVMCTVVTDANVANRYGLLRAKHGGTTIDWVSMTPAAHTASVTATHAFAPGTISTTTLRTYNMGPLPSEGLELMAGAKFQFVFDNIQATDNAGPMYYSYKEIDE